MVVFTCNHCGDSIHKPKVEKHYSFVCRTGKSLTCVDCLKDFRGEDYSTHTKCLTEEERYSAKGSMPGGVVKKGEAKQESWMEMLKNISVREGLRPPIRNMLNNMLTNSNIPRKKTKFMNFMKSASGGRVNMNDVEEVWNIIESYKNDGHAVESNGLGGEGNADHEKSKEETNISDVNGIQDNTGDTKSKKKKKKRDSSALEINGNEEKSNGVQDEKPKEKKKKAKQSSVEETEVQPTIIPNEDDAKTIKDKKKKNKHSSVQESEDNPSITMNDDDTTSIKEKEKKKKAKQSSVEEAEVQPTIIPNEDDATTIKDKKKKNKHSSVQESEDNPSITVNEDDTTSIKEKEKKKKDSLAEETGNKPINTNENDINVEKKKKKKHSSTELDNHIETVNGDMAPWLHENGADETVPAKKPKMGTVGATFDFKENILTVLTGKESISLKKLEKKVLKAYKTFTGDGECSPKVLKKFQKSLKRLDGVDVNDDLVQLRK